MNNVESVYSRAPKGQRLYTVIVKMTTQANAPNETMENSTGILEQTSGT